MRISDEPIAKAVFGSTLKRKILRFLFKDQEPVSERELSRIFGVSHTAVNKAMKQLLDLNIVKGKTVGTALVWELNQNSVTYGPVRTFLTVSEFNSLDTVKKMIKDEILRSNDIVLAVRRNLESGLAKRGFPTIVEAHIIGSVAEGTSRPDSDIDLLLIVEDGYDKEALRRVIQEDLGIRILEGCGNELSVHIYTKNEADKNKPSWLRKSVMMGMRLL